MKIFQKIAIFALCGALVPHASVQAMRYKFSSEAKQIVRDFAPIALTLAMTASPKSTIVRKFGARLGFTGGEITTLAGVTTAIKLLGLSPSLQEKLGDRWVYGTAFAAVLYKFVFSSYLRKFLNACGRLNDTIFFSTTELDRQDKAWDNYGEVNTYADINNLKNIISGYKVTDILDNQNQKHQTTLDDIKKEIKTKSTFGDEISTQQINNIIEAQKFDAETNTAFASVLAFAALYGALNKPFYSWVNDVFGTKIPV